MVAPKIHSFSLTAQGLPDQQEPFFDTNPTSANPVPPIRSLSYQLRWTSPQLLNNAGLPPTQAFLRILGFNAPLLEYGRKTNPNSPTLAQEHRMTAREGGVRILLTGWTTVQQNTLSVQVNNEEASHVNTLTIPMNTVLTNDVSFPLDVRSLQNEATISMDSVGTREILNFTNTYVIVPNRFYNDDSLAMQLILMYD
jgi:hypothetical protein